MNKFFRNVSFYLLIIIIAISIIDYYSSRTTTKQEISYTQFLKSVEEQKVERVTIVDNTIRGKLRDGTEFTTVTPNDPTLIAALREKNVDIKAEQPPQPPWWTTIFSSVLPMLLLIGVWFFIMQQTQGGGNRVMSFG
ncbi:MAG TPA: ATP-dependent metallopeptidase FtsH/Yme1/Tma family protein, partial [Negativicutes bacterium]|nr:ATP-dependent metallopeptidase FtsH/Yme1/Tma family protein [Negativicutes bacterium]